MYVCICHGITARDVMTCVAEGARTLGDLRARLGIATDCGQCAQCAEEYLPASCDCGKCSQCSNRASAVPA